MDQHSKRRVDFLPSGGADSDDRSCVCNRKLGDAKDTWLRRHCYWCYTIAAL